ncbi:hypothetical protein SAY86_007415 [Trapa natans]|uniref:PUM-HD domain-containing protein n=1 Tax=Trapa natans TaxID=22666 RepID=A0AAN7LBM4_TRANT|nr:hypothetical protein SAY86_007415 [Trapa natans]
MAAENQLDKKFKKRKLGKVDVGSHAPILKKAKRVNAKPASSKDAELPQRLQKKQHGLSKPKKSDVVGKGEALTKKERREHAKELTVLRKKKRKPHYTLEQELASLWEKMRLHNIVKDDRSRLVSEALTKMKGKIFEIASSHVSSRVLQTCVKYCTQSERDAVFEELKQHFLTLSCNTYAVHLVKKMLDNASKKQLAGFISSLHGHVASLLRHMVGSVVVEHAYQLGNASQKQELLMELYSTELQLFKDLIATKKSRLEEVISKLGLQKGSVGRHMSTVIQPILEKGIVDHSIIHRILMEYLGIADKTSAADVLQQLSGPLLVRMIHTRDGSRIGILCVKHGSAKERKKILKGMKGHVGKIAYDQCGTLVLACILSLVDDTKLATKIVIRELQAGLKESVFDKNGRRPLLQLLHPNCTRYLSPDDLASLNLCLANLSSMDASKSNDEAKYMDAAGTGEGGIDNDVEINEEEAADDDGVSCTVDGGKKDPSLRRQELLISSGLAESLVDVCIEKTEELLMSNFGKEVLYEVATGGAGGILLPSLGDKLSLVHEAIASLAAKPKPETSQEEHVLENFHSSRTIRKLILDSSAFAVTLWEKALRGSFETWAHGHSAKVVSAFLESSDSKVRELTEKELQPLVDGGVLNMHGAKET